VTLVFWCIVAIMGMIALAFVLVPLNYKRWSVSNLLLSIAIVIFLPLASFYFYHRWGDLKGVEQYYFFKKQESVLKRSPEKVIEMLKARLAQDPRSAQGWFLLGRMYLTLGQFNKASQALYQANYLQPHRIETQILYAQALYFARGQKLQGKAKQMINAILKRDPQNPSAINLLAIAAYHQHNYQKAIAYWQQLLPTFPGNSEDAKALRHAIASAQRFRIPKLVEDQG